jgi:hypothetical protein
MVEAALLVMAPLDYAVVYAEQGWPVFPLRPPANTPYTEHGFHDATTDGEQIRAWWAEHPTANVGIRTGIAFDVLDIDHDDYCQGVADLPNKAKEIGSEPTPVTYLNTLARPAVVPT